MTISACPVCGGSHLSDVFSCDLLPKYNLTYSTTRSESFSIDRSSVKFVHCQSCDFVFNSIFQQLDYKETSYDASRAHSQLIIDYYHSTLNAILPYVERVTKVVEVGAGDCYFSGLMNQYLACDVIAFDPTFLQSESIGGVEKKASYYDSSQFCNPDIVVFRHVLEHISDVRGFLAQVLHESPRYTFIEIPCSEYVAQNNWHYFSNEHCSYFSTSCLSRLMKDYGYKNIFCDIVFNGENIIALFERVEQNQKIDNSSIGASQFCLKENHVNWQQRIRSNLTPGSVIWGAAGKGVTSLNLLGMTNSDVIAAVDVNPNLWGKFIPGTGIQIISPETLCDNYPDVSVYIMNPLYEGEIKNCLAQLSFNGCIKHFFV